MKYKFVYVWDNYRIGRIPHIILQVEEKDKFLINNHLNPGYKIIITAVNKNIGAAGGHTFYPYYIEESVKEVSRKIITNESDALGFYISNIDDIYDVPDDLFTEKFWSVIQTSREKRNSLYNELDNDYGVDEYSIKNYYKLLVVNTFKNSTLKDIENISVEFIIINKETMKIEDVRWSTDTKDTIADYLWCPFDELPDELWNNINDVDGKLTFRKKLHEYN